MLGIHSCACFRSANLRPSGMEVQWLSHDTKTIRPSRPICFCMVRTRGLEPPRVSPLPPQSSASTNSATSARRSLRLLPVCRLQQKFRPSDYISPLKFSKRATSLPSLKNRVAAPRLPLLFSIHKNGERTRLSYLFQGKKARCQMRRLAYRRRRSASDVTPRKATTPQMTLISIVT